MENLFFHDSHDEFYRCPFGAVECAQKITIRLKLHDTSLKVDSAVLRLWENGAEKKIPMDKFLDCTGKTIYQCDITAPKEAGLLWYYFIIQCRGAVYYYGNNPENLGGVGATYCNPPSSYQITVYKKNFTTPSWFKDSIMYQIMVDRFYNGNDDGHIDSPKKNSIIHKDWYDTPNYMPDPSTGEFLCNDFFGGNLKGIIKKLSYLKDLGVNVIYLNPIFESPSNHKYNTSDYLKIDAMFGDEKIFKALVDSARKLGISIILDGVFSHTGSDSIYFNREGNFDSIGAFQSKDSLYYKWYKFIDYPYDYESWWGIKTLPNVNELEPSYQNFILDSKNSVINHWMRLGISGWRLDVADELPDEFLKKIRKAVKSQNKDAVIIGEVWEDASNKISYGVQKQYLLGDELDSVMNYSLMKGILNFFTGKCSGSYLNRIINSLYENYPKECFYSMMNILGTHDTCRILYALAEIGTDRVYSREEQALLKLSPQDEEIALKRLKLASLFQMTFPGVPSIYYGDEAGLGGCKDPFNRKTYPWGKENKCLLKWYKKICGLRHSIDALKTGTFSPVHFGEDTYGFVRAIDNGIDVFGQYRNSGIALILFNRSSKDRHDLLVDLRKWKVNKLSDAIGDRGEFTSSCGCFNIGLSPLEGLVLYSGHSK
jgi:cyclomaltodextrinase